jgi:hypothetical protein
VGRHAASPRVSARTHKLSPRNLSQDDFWNMGNGKCQSGNCIGNQSLDQHSHCKHCCPPNHGKGNGIHGTHEGPITPAPLEKRIWKRWAAFSKASATFKEPIRVFLLSSRTSPRTDTSHTAKLCVTISLTKRKNNGSDSQWMATGWIIPAKWIPPPRTSLH